MISKKLILAIPLNLVVKEYVIPNINIDDILDICLIAANDSRTGELYKYYNCVDNLVADVLGGYYEVNNVRSEDIVDTLDKTISIYLSFEVTVNKLLSNTQGLTFHNPRVIDDSLIVECNTM